MMTRKDLILEAISLAETGQAWEIAELAGLDSSLACAHLSQLERAGLVTRAKSPWAHPSSFEGHGLHVWAYQEARR